MEKFIRIPDQSMKGKTVSESKVEMIELVLPNDTNTFGNILGGRVMHLMDMACAMAAIRHARHQVVTVSVDRLDFRNPIPLGNMMILKASVNYVGRTSMEVGVKVLSENPLTGEQQHTSSAYLTFVALDEKGKPAEIPPLIPETEEEKRRYEEGKTRRLSRSK
jgi:acyl-CoA hydrolase